MSAKILQINFKFSVSRDEYAQAVAEAIAVSFQILPLVTE